MPTGRRQASAFGSAAVPLAAPAYIERSCKNAVDSAVPQRLPLYAPRSVAGVAVRLQVEPSYSRPVDDRQLQALRQRVDGAR